MKESGEAAAYLGSRGIENAELVETFKLGFANRTLGYRLPPKQVKAGATVRAQLQRLGVLRESGHEHMSGSLVVPIFDEHGAVVEMYGRKITPGLRPGTPLHMYLPGPHRGVFNAQALKVSKDVILCEVADRCADVLVRGVSERDDVLRRGGLYAGAARGLRRVRRGARADCLRCG